MLFGLLLLIDSEVERPDELFSIIALVVLMSVVLHGATATPGARRYGEWFSDMGDDDDDMMEAGSVTESPLRWSNDNSRRTPT